MARSLSVLWKKIAFEAKRSRDAAAVPGLSGLVDSGVFPDAWPAHVAGRSRLVDPGVLPDAWPAHVAGRAGLVDAAVACVRRGGEADRQGARDQDGDQGLCKCVHGFILFRSGASLAAPRTQAQRGNQRLSAQLHGVCSSRNVKSMDVL